MRPTTTNPSSAMTAKRTKVLFIERSCGLMIISHRGGDAVGQEAENRGPGVLADTPGPLHHRGCHTHEGVHEMDDETKAALAATIARVGAAELVFRALILQLLEGDREERRRTIKALIANIELLGRNAVIGETIEARTLAETTTARRAIVRTAIAMVADLGIDASRRQ